MRRIRIPRPSAALIVATIALIVALGGTAYAGLSIPRNSVGTKQIKNGAVTSSKIKRGAVTGRQIKLSSLGTVPSANTATTAQSAQPEAYANVEANGTLVTSVSKNVGAVTEVAPGEYCLSGIPFTPAGGVATVAYAGSTTQYAQFGVGAVNAGCPSGAQAVVFTQKSNNSNNGSPANFFVVLYS